MACFGHMFLKKDNNTLNEFNLLNCEKLLETQQMNIPEKGKE